MVIGNPQQRIYVCWYACQVKFGEGLTTWQKYNKFINCNGCASNFTTFAACEFVNSKNCHTATSHWCNKCGPAWEVHSSCSIHFMPLYIELSQEQWLGLSLQLQSTVWLWKAALQELSHLATTTWISSDWNPCVNVHAQWRSFSENCRLEGFDSVLVVHKHRSQGAFRWLRSICQALYRLSLPNTHWTLGTAQLVNVALSTTGSEPQCDYHHILNTLLHCSLMIKLTFLIRHF